MIMSEPPDIARYRRSLAECERTFGADHPRTLTARNNLAYTYQSLGDLKQAITLFEQNLGKHSGLWPAFGLN
jgi:tetratricopeptide (TPR) repeat protein